MSKSILITGCSSGIGLDAVRTMKARGWRVIATARTPEDLARLKSEEGVDSVHLELADPKSIAQCAADVLALTGGKLDALFSNAAHGQPGAVEDLTPELLRHQLEVNVIGTHDLTRRFIPAMRKQGSGRIVQCSSILGFVSVSYRGAYCASKHALNGLTNALRMELEGTGIKVTLIEPGPIRSRFVENAMNNLISNIDIENSPHRDLYNARLEGMRQGGKSFFKLEPSAVSKRLVHALESSSPRRRYYVTTPTYLAAFFNRFMPPVAAEYFAKKF